MPNIECSRHKISFYFDLKQEYPLGSPSKAFPVEATSQGIWLFIWALLKRVEEMPEIHRVHTVKYEDTGMVLHIPSGEGE